MANTLASAPNYGNAGNKRRSAEGANVLSESFFRLSDLSCLCIIAHVYAVH